MASQGYGLCATDIPIRIRETLAAESTSFFPACQKPKPHLIGILEFFSGASKAVKGKSIFLGWYSFFSLSVLPGIITGYAFLY